ncbi:hypothetical protein Unana1_00086 [Umbelopsis nana]
MASNPYERGSTSYSHVVYNGTVPTTNQFTSKKLNDQATLCHRDTLNPSNFPVHKIDWSLLCEPVQDAIKRTLREFNNNQSQSVKLTSQVTDLTHRTKEKDFPSFITTAIKVPTFHLDLNTPEAERNLFVYLQRQEVERCRLSILSNVLATKSNSAGIYQSACQTTSVLKSQLKLPLNNALDMHITESLQDEYAEQCLLALQHVHYHEKASAAEAIIEIDQPATVTETIEQLVHNTVWSILGKPSMPTRKTKKTAKLPRKDNTKSNMGKGRRPMRKGPIMGRTSNGPPSQKTVRTSPRIPPQTHKDTTKGVPNQTPKTRKNRT